MAFSIDTKWDAFDRQNARCAGCGKSLVWENTEPGLRGAWHAHHRLPISYNGTDSLRNCAILCINYPDNCHLYVGHNGDYKYHNPLNEDKAPFLYG